jgi:hypothetical protein
MIGISNKFDCFCCFDIDEESIVDGQVLKLSDSDRSNENSFNGRLNMSIESGRSGAS